MINIIIPKVAISAPQIELRRSKDQATLRHRPWYDVAKTKLRCGTDRATT